MSEVREITDVIGTTGIYQVLLVGVALYLSAVTGCSGVFIQLLAPDVHLSWRSGSAPNGSDVTWDSSNCKRRDLDQMRPDHNGSVDLNSTLVYFSKYSHNTLTEKFDLICERSWYISFSNSLIMIGGFIGSIIFGQICEKIGRKKSTLLLGIPIIGANLLILFSVNYPMFAVGCFVYGAAAIPLVASTTITVPEFISIKHRSAIATVTKFGMIGGQVSVAVFSWVFEDWFYTQVAHTAFAASAFLVAWYMLESPVWLAVKGKESEAIENLKIIIRRNRIKSDDVDSKITQWIEHIKSRSSVKKTTSEGSLTDLFRTPTMRMYTLSATFVAISTNFAYYGLTMNMEIFGTDLYVDFMVSSGLAIASMVICIVCLLRVSIRKFIIGFNLLMVLVCAIYPAVYNDKLGRSVMISLARLFVTAPLNTGFTYSAEILPTSVRAVGIGFFTSTSRVASAFSSFTKELGEKTYTYVPIVLFGGLILAASALLWKILPETKGKPFFNTVKDLESHAAAAKQNKEGDSEVIIQDNI